MTTLFTTVFIFRRPGWDDLMIVFSLVGSIVASSLVQTSADLGLGRHTAAVASEPGGTQRMAKTKILHLVLAIVPIHAFWKLQLKVQEKLEITFMLGLAFLSAIFTIIKATYLDTFNDRTDPLYNVVTLIIWGLIEQNIVIMAASVPTPRPLLRLIKDKHPMRSAVGYIKSGSGTDPKHNASISEIPLGNVQQKAEQGSEPSWETHSSSEELNGRRATPPFE
ncbi:hypothetical protein BFJ69_g1376 [Fusarium oxysporum]|uniref:Rhodopsin domain-containing protein n=1 Tax=Fusarium oxysporum TaxID=5507 RepID=A0A420NZV8_FUSOX|nr:hypothetical protein BFJ69_g1376 [Fusarium oxysporum]